MTKLVEDDDDDYDWMGGEFFHHWKLALAAANGTYCNLNSEIRQLSCFSFLLSYIVEGPAIAMNEDFDYFKRKNKIKLLTLECLWKALCGTEKSVQWEWIRFDY